MKTLLLFASLLFISRVSAQFDTDKWDVITIDHKYHELGITAGAHVWLYSYFELGLAYAKSSGNGCAFGSEYHGHSLSAEYDPFRKRGAAVYTYWTSAGTFLTFGSNINSYTDGTHWNVGFKPFIGFGPGSWSVTYGYNFQLYENKVTDINTHTFSVRYFLPVVTL